MNIAEGGVGHDERFGFGAETEMDERKSGGRVDARLVYPRYTGLEERLVQDLRTLSVVEDMARKSPVIIEMTISIGVRIACLVRIKPKARNST